MNGLLGKTLKHSASKEIHEKINNEEYNLFEVEDLKAFFSEKKFNFVNVTIPYKTEVIKYLDYKDEKVLNTGSCNLIINEKGYLKGYNTDYDGFNATLKYFNVNVKEKNILIIGNGGAKNTIYQALKDLNAKNIYVACRTKKQDDELYFNEVYNLEIDIIINATPSSMYPNNNDKLLIDIKRFKSLETCIDLIYNPLWTNLLIRAKNLKIKAINGLYMLVYQAYKAEEIYLNRKFSVEEINDFYLSFLKKRMNIVLIGMPNSGKSFKGKSLGKALNKEFIDTDDVIEKKEKMAISEIFSSKGEKHFRLLENEVADEIYLLNNKIISTGGGMVLNKEIMRKLAQNGLVIYLDVTLEKLKNRPQKNRPLIRNMSSFDKLYQTRNRLYNFYADIKVLDEENIEVKINEYLCNKRA